MGLKNRKVSIWQLSVIFVPSTLLLVALAGVKVFGQIKMETLTQNIRDIVKIHSYSGILSNLGIILWCVSACVCLFTATTLRNIKPRETFWFLLCSGLLSAYLLFDEDFQFHEAFAPHHFGLDESIVYLILGIVAFAYLFAFRRFILQTNFDLLALAIGFLASHIVINTILWKSLQGLGDWKYLLSGGTKWLGIVCWCSYFVYTSYLILIGHFNRHSA
jgi:hypothetical protein